MSLRSNELKIIKKPNKFSRDRFLYPEKVKEIEKLIEEQNKKEEEDRIKLEKSKLSKIMKLREKYKNFNLEKLLLEKGFDINNLPNYVEWLDISIFDNSRYIEKNPKEWIEYFHDNDGNKIQITGKALLIGENYILNWKDVIIKDFNEEKNTWIINTIESDKDLSVKNINLILDIEDPRIYVNRIINAYAERIFKDSQIKYNFYIDNMPVDEFIYLNNNIKKRILSKAKNMEKYEESISIDILSQELSHFYSRTINKIIFDEYLKLNKENNLMKNQLILPPEYYSSNNETHENGLIEINRVDYTYEPKGDNFCYPSSKEFTEKFKEFCFNTFLNKKNIITALKQIELINNELLKRDLFNFNQMSFLRQEDFKNFQENFISINYHYIKINWINDIVKIIQNNLANEKEGWFDLKNVNPNNYQKGKLKKFLNLVKFKMQDVLYKFIDKNFKKYVNTILKFIPNEVIINSERDVKTIFNDETIDSNNFELYKIKNIPLFLIEIKFLNGVVCFNNNLDSYINIILNLFSRTLEEFSKIQEIESKIIDKKIKITIDKYLKVPKLIKEKLITPDPNLRPKKYIDENIWIYNLYKKLKLNIKKAIYPLEDYLKLFSKYNDKLNINSEEFLSKLKEESKDKNVEFLLKKINNIKNEEKEFLDKVKNEIIISLFFVDIKDIITKILNINKDIINGIYQIIAQKAQTKGIEIFEEFKNIEKELKKNPEDIENLIKQEEYINSEIPIILDKLKNETENVMNLFEILDDGRHKMPKDDKSRLWLIYGGPKDINSICKNKLEKMEIIKIKYYQNMQKEQDDFQEKFEILENDLRVLYKYNDVTKHKKLSEKMIEYNKQLKDFIDLTNLFNSREELFEKNKSDYSKIHQIFKNFYPFYNLWTTINKWYEGSDLWINDDWKNINAIEAENFCDNSPRTLNQVISFFKEKNSNQYSEIIKIAEDTKGKIDQFKVKVPLLVALKSQGMNERHWKMISEKVGFEINPNNDFFNFQYLLDKNLDQYLNFCIEIGEKANKEFGIEKNLLEMKKEWEKLYFEFTPFKNTGYNLIKGFDDIENILDNHLNNTGNMLVSPFKKYFEKDIEEWNNTLIIISNVIEEWRIFQKNWAYLQPIFDSPNISKQLSAANNLFRKTDKFYKSITNSKFKKTVVEICTEEDLLDKLKKSNEDLDLIQTDLNGYLEFKRSKFARFYFLSNDELLSILSEVKEVEKVQEHLRKVFENINKLLFEKDKTIHAMFSVEGEKIDFLNVLDPKRKEVEDWMGEVENEMKATVREELLNSITNYKNIPRIEWIFKHPGQFILNGSQVNWTYEVEKSLDDDKLKEYLDVMNNNLLNIVKMERSNFNIMQNISIEALIVLDIHALDVVQTLISSNIKNKDAFEWISQLRYYWENDDCYIKCIQTNFPYGYEYLGNTSRLVITPLTDKCYMTLMGAIQLNLGGAPAGPAGTGKTETTKDLAKALAKQCVVFNCQESMTYKFVAGFFKGLASSGAWCCFDEFNRINIEVLSVIAQQLQELFLAKAENKLEIRFEMSDIKVIPTFSVYITMNPGYAGRTELPDNLKALFRPVAMMIPDYALIAQLKLYSFGFTQAKELSRKMIDTFKLSSEQLSFQKHYDYGMRAVTSVINAAGLLKRKADKNEDESQILLKALKDVNVPKFLKDDIPLYENIIKDLFPTTDQPEFNYGELLSTINNTCDDRLIQKHPEFIKKILQLFDTIKVRHGLMLVGPTGGGKTTNYRILAESITNLSKNNNDPNFKKVNIDIINPKSITLSELYGESKDMNWNEGIIEIVVEKAISNQNQDEYQWIMFDGPVDAVWIESMNTVLDDNKKLCLSSGKVLILSKLMTMMFEVEDLKEASPATVSRCGMIYMEPESLGIKPLIESYIKKIPKLFLEKKEFVKNIYEYIDLYFYSSLEFKKNECIEIIETFDSNLVSSFIKLFDSLFKNYSHFKEAEEINSFLERFESLILFSVIWSVGCTSDNKSKIKFNKFLLNQINKSGKTTINIEGIKNEKNLINLYDYEFKYEENDWVNWLDNDNYEIPSGSLFHEIAIPTKDYVRYLYFMKLLLTNKYHVMTPGEIGTGKTVNALKLLSNNLPEDFTSITMSLSAQTSPNHILETIFSQLEKRGKELYGPGNKKKCIVYIDDLNMPKLEIYGAQPPIELLRQYLDHQSWYIMKLNKRYIKIEDIIILTSMGKPGGGRNFITNRIIRHFNMLSYSLWDDQVISNLFKKILNFFLVKFNIIIKSNIENIINSNIKLFHQFKTQLLPTPSKSHYLFNLRDLSNVFQGICTSSFKHINNIEDFLRLYVHENTRVFHDRLINQDDRKLFFNLINDELDKTFSISLKNIQNQEKILFADFQNTKDGINRPYRLVTDLDSFVEKINQYLDDFNREVGPKKQMKLVMFLDACEHISRICRVLRNPLGHVLLMGVGGSGRQSLSKLSSYILSLKIFQIEVGKGYNIVKWREDLKKLILNAVDNKPNTFLFVDTQIIDEQMVEDINCLLNSGNIVNIKFNQEELKKIQDTSKSICQREQIIPNKINMHTAYLNRIKSNIHVLFAMSPLNKMFANRLRMFPSFINNCYLNWFTEWPEEALIGVGRGAIIDYKEEFKLTEIFDKIIEVFNFMHKSVEKISIKYKNELNRNNYVTSTSYLELLNLYKIIVMEKNKDLNFLFNRFSNGLEKLNNADNDVKELKEKLKDEEPKLKIADEETKILLIDLDKDRKSQNEIRIIVSKEEAEATIQQQKALKLKKEVEIKKEEGDKKLQETLKAVDNLEKKDLTEAMSLNNPNQKFLLYVKGILFLLYDNKEIPGIYKKNDKDIWSIAREKFKEKDKMLQILKEDFDKENIEPKKIQIINNQITNNPNWNESSAKVSSVVAHVFFLWVEAMLIFNKTWIELEPLRNTLDEANRSLEEKTKFLNEKRETLKKSTIKLKELEDIYNSKIAFKEELKRKINECHLKLDRANKLTELLADEKKRWFNEIVEIKKNIKLIPGNSLIAAGMVSYSGPFTSNYRKELENNWINKLKELNIPHSEDITMSNFLGDPVLILKWNLNGLPKDETSIENGIILRKSKRWPLLIDPQSQGLKFIKNLGKENNEGCEIIKATNNTIMRSVEQGILFGKWIIIENIGIEIDPSFDPILNQQIIISGGSKSITLGDKPITYNDNFKFFLISKNSNPHYSPELSAKVTIINFGITPKGLQDQMLAIVVGLENPEIEERKELIIKTNADDKKKLKEIEDNILKGLNESQSDILMDENLIISLGESKITSTEINKRMEESEVTEKEIDSARENYIPVAFRASLLYFCISNLSIIDPMYQYSLQWFENLFKIGVENAPQSNEIKIRLENLNSYFTYSLYSNICRSLFGKHKLLFSFMLTIKLLEGDNDLNHQEFKILISGYTGEVEIEKNFTDWIDENTWNYIYKELYGLNTLPNFIGILEEFKNNNHIWKELYDSNEPEKIEFPGKWNKISVFQKILIIKCFRPDKLINIVQIFIEDNLGKKYVEAPIFKLKDIFNDSNCFTPLIFILSSGTDPKADFDAFAQEHGVKNINSISLGQGQEQKAEKMIMEYSKPQSNGGWILLQNCHLCLTMMPLLEAKCEEFNLENTHNDFRLWLTSMPDAKFPISILQNSIKMSIEPPSGIKANLKTSYNMIDDNLINDCKKSNEFKKLLFGLCLFHSVIYERRKFGPIGWNIPYEFTIEDLVVCRKQLKLFLDEYEEIPYKVLNFICAEINYGGRVTDDKDKRLINNIILTFINQDVLKDDYLFSNSGIYKSIPAGSAIDYLNYIENLPRNPSPEIFGLHNNAEITNSQNESFLLLNNIKSIQPKNSGGDNNTREEIILKIVTIIENKIPDIINVKDVIKKYPTKYEESMNTVLAQEIYKYRNLLVIMKQSLKDLKMGLKGLIILNDELESLSNSLFFQEVPQIWGSVFLSLKPLFSWLTDLVDRMNFFRDWYENNIPNVFWFSGFCFPQAFITGLLQNYARKTKESIDKISFDFKIIDNLEVKQINKKPEIGAYIYGMFLEGAKWDYKIHHIIDPKPKELFSKMPIVWFIPKINREINSKVYNCPIYKVVSRSGTLSTSGHSTNYVMNIELPSEKKEEIWINAGVAIFLSLKY